MYENNEVTKVLGAGIVSGTSIAVLPNTSGNTIGTILAYTAIGIGLAALVSQLVVRIIRRRYAKKEN